MSIIVQRGKCEIKSNDNFKLQSKVYKARLNQIKILNEVQYYLLAHVSGDAYINHLICYFEFYITNIIITFNPYFPQFLSLF